MDQLRPAGDILVRDTLPKIQRKEPVITDT